MAQFVGPRHRLYQTLVPRVVEAAPAPVEPAARDVHDTGDRGWFDSSLELRQGLDVAELNDFPVDLPAAGRGGRAD